MAESGSTDNIWSIIGKIVVGLFALYGGISLFYKPDANLPAIDAESKQTTRDTTIKKFSFFLSSTFKDLKDLRQNIEIIIRDAGHFVNSMENFRSSDSNKLSYIESKIKESDYLILIIGNRYGELIPDKNISYTEYEFDYAERAEVPILSFVITDPEDTDESIENRNKLIKFKEKIEKRMTTHCTTEDLIKKIPTSINDEIGRNPRPGWSRNPEDHNT